MGPASSRRNIKFCETEDVRAIRVIVDDFVDKR